MLPPVKADSAPQLLDAWSSLKYFPEAESWRRDKPWIQFPFKDDASDGSNLTASEED